MEREKGSAERPVSRFRFTHIDTCDATEKKGKRMLKSQAGLEPTYERSAE